MKNKKITVVALLAAAVAAVSGCGGSEQQKTDVSETTASAAETSVAETTVSKENVTETSVIYQAEDEAPDTTEDSIKYLRERSPLLAKYFEIHTSLPFSMVSVNETADGDYESGIIIKDEQTMAQYVTDPKGNTTRVVYDYDTAYQINVNEKIVYKSQVGAFFIKSGVSGHIMKMPIEEVVAMEFKEDTATYEGVEYKHASLGSGGEVYSDYYFDKDTEELKLVVNNSGVTRFKVYENDVYDEGLFAIPDDYEVKSGDVLLETNEEGEEPIITSANE